MPHRVLLAAALIAASLTAGCAGTGAPAVTPPGEGRFVTVWWTCGFVARGTICTHWQLDADGTFVAFEGAWAPGNGTIDAEDEALYNVTTSEIRGVLETFDLYNASRNYTVELAYRGHATDGEITTLLEPAATFYQTQRRYDDRTITDAGTLNIQVESDRGLHTSSAYTGDGDEAFDGMRDAFFDIRDDVEDRLGIPEDR